MEQVLLSGGIVKSEWFAAQIAADVLGLPVVVRKSSEEGSAYGAAILAEFADAMQQGLSAGYDEFMAAKATADPGHVFMPTNRAKVIDQCYERFTLLNSSAKPLQHI